MSEVLADPECDMEHLFGLAALDTVEYESERRLGYVSVERCDQCSADEWTDMEAAEAVAARFGTSVADNGRRFYVKIGG